MKTPTIIQCYECESKVEAKLLATKNHPATDDSFPSRYYFLECPSCQSPMIAYAEMFLLPNDEWGYENMNLVWPKPNKSLDLAIPALVRDSIEEARKCFHAKAYSACAVMCGRSIEALGKDHKIKSFPLGKGLKLLKDKEVIDGRLFEWGKALRDRRNIGAHATSEQISREDAQDVLDFATAICEYVYVLTDKYVKFKERESKK